MMSSDIMLAEHRVRLLAEGALFLPDHRALVIADLHLEKGTSRRERGVLLPPYDTQETLARVQHLVARIQPETVIALGDSFHDRSALNRLTPESVVVLDDLAARVALIWVTGNHDPLTNGPLTNGAMPGSVVDECRLGTLTLRHVPMPEITPGAVEIAGHLHPKIRLRVAGHAMSRRCFVTGERRVLMPAFGSYTGGLDVTMPAIRDLYRDLPEVWALGRQRLYRLGKPVWQAPTARAPESPRSLSGKRLGVRSSVRARNRE